MPPKKVWPVWLEALSSIRLALFCLGLAMGLVLAGTLAQVHLGTFVAQKLFFNSFWVYADIGDWKLPVFPGGLTIGTLWFVNLTANFITRFRLERSSIGLYVSHLGLIILLIGQFLTQTLSRETQMPIPIGESRNYSESARDTVSSVRPR